MPLVPGARLGPYQVVSLLGAGGMGEVYRAHDTKLGRDVALKVLPAAFTHDAERVARFQREAHTLAALNHPNIGGIYGLEEADGVTALVMELVEGEELSQRIAKGAIPIDEALRIAKQITEALEAAHEQGIIHRDLKPANIKVRADGLVKALDFGLAKAPDRAGEAGAAGRAGQDEVSQSPTITTAAHLRDGYGGQAMTLAGMILGTAAYMSPEQARGKPVDKRADIWAFGVVLFEMLTGRRPFAGDTISDTLASVLKTEPAWGALPVGTPTPIRRLLRRCLEKDPTRRLQAIGDARVEIEELLDRRADDDVVAAPAGVPPWRRALPWALVGLVAVVAVGAFTLYPRQPHQPAATVRFTVFPPPGATRAAGARGTFAISPDGQTLAFEGKNAAGTPLIYVRRLDAAEAQPLEGTNNASSPFWSPDSRSIGFFNDGGLYRIGLDGSAPRRLCDVPGSTFLGGTWGTRGAIVFASSGVGLLRVPETGGTATTPVTTLDATAKEASHASPQFLPDGRHVLFVVRAGASSGVIWTTSIDEPSRTRITESAGGAAYANGWLLYTTGVRSRDLVARRFDAARLAIEGEPQLVRDRLSGSTVIGQPGFSVSESGGVLTVDRPLPLIQQLTWVDRGGRILATIGSAASIPDFALAPNGTRIVATVMDPASLKHDLWLFDGRQQGGTRLTYQGDTARPLWAVDGRHIYFDRTLPNRGLYALAIGGTAPAAGFENPGGFIHFEDATRDGRYLVLVGQFPTGLVSIQRVVDPGERRPLVQDEYQAVQARVSPDGRWLAFTLLMPGGMEVFAQPFDRSGERIRVSPGGGIGPIWRDDSRELYYEAPDGLMAASISETNGIVSAGIPQKLFDLHTQGRATNFPHNVEVAEHGQKFLVNTVVAASNNAPLEVTVGWMRGLKQ